MEDKIRVNGSFDDIFHQVQAKEDMTEEFKESFENIYDDVGEDYEPTYGDYGMPDMPEREAEEMALDDGWCIDEDDYNDFIDNEGPFDPNWEEPDPADRDMGEMYGNYGGDASFFESTYRESLRFPAEHYASEALKDLIGTYSRMEYEEMGEDDKYEACFDAALSYVDGDSDNFNEEAQSIADILYDKMEKGAFSESKLLPNERRRV